MFRKSTSLTLIVMVVSLSLPACKTTKPASDSTPPKLRWLVVHHPSNIQENLDGAGSPQVNQALNETLTVTVVAEDPEGIHEITLGCNEATTICGMFSCGPKGGLKVSGQELMLPPATQTLNPDSNGNVQTQMTLGRDIKPKDLMVCGNPTYVVKDADFTLIGNGQNYSQGKTQSKLRICNPTCL